METGLLQLAVILTLATVLGFLARFLRQPVILAYLTAGALIGLFGFFDVIGHETFQIFSNLGIMFLLFLVGLEVNYTSLRHVGKTSLIVGLGQILFTFGVGYVIAQSFGFSLLTSAYIAIALTFSSTIIIVKLLSEKKDLNSLYGKISIGFMLVQDVVAILLLVILASAGTGGVEMQDLIFTMLKGVGIIIALVWLGRKILPYVFDQIARSQELLFLGSVAWVLVVAEIVTRLGFSIEIGGFLAGLALANSSEHFQIASRIKSLRDFFILIFFVILGSSLIGFDFSGLTWPIIVFSLFVLLGNPLIVLILMGTLGYRKRTSFLAGVTVAQISEFSFILAALGLKLGHIDESIHSLIIAVGVITITLSTYLIIYGDHIVHRFSRSLSVFERRNTMEEDLPEEGLRKPVVLIGANRTGESIAYHIHKNDLLIVDFNPDVVRKFKAEGFSVLLGDISDEDIVEKIDFDTARIIISTSPDFEDNLHLLQRAQTLAGRKKIIVRADNEAEAELLYKNGAHYVVFPHLTSGHYLGKHIGEDLDVAFLADLKKKDLAVIRRRTR